MGSEMCIRDRDVAVITPDKGFVWINKKKLRVGDVEIDIDKEPNLPKR